MVDQLREAPRVIRVIIGLAIAGLIVLAILGMIIAANAEGPELGDGTTVSQACLDHFEHAAWARGDVPTRTAASFSWVGVDMSGAFSDCKRLSDWNVAASLHPGAMTDTDVEGFV